MNNVQTTAGDFAAAKNLPNNRVLSLYLSRDERGVRRA
jgi:hypothetical protein